MRCDYLLENVRFLSKDEIGFDVIFGTNHKLIEWLKFPHSNYRGLATLFYILYGFFLQLLLL